MKNLLYPLAVLLLIASACKKTTASATPSGNIPSATASLPANTTYYIDATGGNDSNNGTSAATAWKTLNKITAQQFSAGDQLLFKAGCTWAGNVVLSGSGTSAAPIIVNMYGTGNKPVINGDPSTNGSVAVLLNNISYWEVNNLEVTNTAPNSQNALTGIKINNSSSAATDHIYIKNCYVHDVTSTVYGSHNYVKGTGGIIFTGFINDVLVQNCHVANCQIEGIRTSSSAQASNVVFDHNLIENIYGDGIVLNGVTGNSKITNNVVHNACITNDANFAGIWTYNSYQTTIAYNEVYGLTGGYIDGEAFDADISTYGDIFEYNYSHDNAGGFMLFMPDAQNIIVRYNVSANDVSGGVKLFNYTATGASNQIYNNTFYINNNVTNIFENSFVGTFANNIIVNQGTVTSFAQKTMTSAARFINNCIYPSNVILATNWAGCYHTGDIFAIPQFVNTTSFGVGSATAAGFALQNGSPCIQAGKPIPGNGGYDFFNKALSATSAPDVGAVMH